MMLTWEEISMFDVRWVSMVICLFRLYASWRTLCQCADCHHHPRVLPRGLYKSSVSRHIVLGHEKRQVFLTKKNWKISKHPRLWRKDLQWDRERTHQNASNVSEMFSNTRASGKPLGPWWQAWVICFVWKKEKKSESVDNVTDFSGKCSYTFLFRSLDSSCIICSNLICVCSTFLCCGLSRLWKNYIENSKNLPPPATDLKSSTEEVMTYPGCRSLWGRAVIQQAGQLNVAAKRPTDEWHSVFERNQKRWGWEQKPPNYRRGMKSSKSIMNT